MLFLFRFIKHILVFFLICLPIMLAGIPMVAIAMLMIKNSDMKLPRLFRWWDNADLYLGRDTSAYRAVCAQGKWARYSWLVFRNPMNYFDYVNLGLKWMGGEYYSHYNPKDNDVGNSTNERPGFKYIEVIQVNSTYYEYYWVYKYAFWPTKCFRFRFGWKIGDNTNKPNTISQWCLVIAPIFPYWGI